MDIGSTAIKAIMLSPGRRTVHLKGFAIAEGADSPLSPSATSKAIEEACCGQTPAMAGTAVADAEILTDSFTLPAHLDDKAIAARVALHIETALKKSHDELCYDYRLESATEDNERVVTLVTARQETIAERQRALTETGLDCRLIDVESHAIARVMQQSGCLPAGESVGIIDLGERLRLAVICDQQCLFRHTVMQFAKGTPLAIAEAVDRVLALYQGHQQAQSLSSLWLLGGHSDRQLAELLSNRLQLPVRCLASALSVHAPESIDKNELQTALPRLITAIGVAMHLGDPNAHWH